MPTEPAQLIRPARIAEHLYAVIPIYQTRELVKPTLPSGVHFRINFLSPPSRRMRLLTFLVVAISLLGLACSRHSKRPTRIRFDLVTPLPKSENKTLENFLGLAFQPTLRTTFFGCHPYPAVNAQGGTSAGRKISKGLTHCHGPLEKSQVYGRVYKANGVLAIMYAWYFPADVVVSPVYFGHRHSWKYVVVFLEKFGGTYELRSVAVKTLVGHSIQSPPKKSNMDGNHVKLKYTWLLVTSHYLAFTSLPGERQPLVMWDDLTEEARDALDSVSFHGKAPISTEKFERLVRKAMDA